MELKKQIIWLQDSTYETSGKKSSFKVRPIEVEKQSTRFQD